jgi:hypothetical protein
MIRLALAVGSVVLVCVGVIGIWREDPGADHMVSVINGGCTGPCSSRTWCGDRDVPNTCDYDPEEAVCVGNCEFNCPRGNVGEQYCENQNSTTCVYRDDSVTCVARLVAPKCTQTARMTCLCMGTISNQVCVKRLCN